MADLTRETKFSGANGDREKNIFPVQLATSRVGNLAGLTHFLLYAVKHPITKGKCNGFSGSTNISPREDISPYTRDDR